MAPYGIEQLFESFCRGVTDHAGPVRDGRLADLVRWQPEYFGAKPQLVLKSGFPAWGVTGDPNAATDRCQPLVIGPQVGRLGAGPAEISVAFVSAAGLATHGRADAWRAPAADSVSLFRLYYL